MKTNTKFTAEDFFQWAQLPANRGHHFDLQAGEVIEMSRPGKFHGFVCGNIAGILRNYAASQRKGYVCSNGAGVIVGR
jgi:Uma2 family endonuclease